MYLAALLKTQLLSTDTDKPNLVDKIDSIILEKQAVCSGGGRSVENQ